MCCRHAVDVLCKAQLTAFYVTLNAIDRGVVKELVGEDAVEACFAGLELGNQGGHHFEILPGWSRKG